MLYIKIRIIVVFYIPYYIPVFIFLLAAFDNNVFLIPIDIMNKSFMIDWKEQCFLFSIMIKERFLPNSIR